MSGSPMKIVSISGASKDVGKSSLAAYIIRRCRECAAVKFSLHQAAPEGDPILEQHLSEGDTGRDTVLMKRAGAHPVYWVRATADTLAELVREVSDRIESPLAVMEGNSFLQYVKPDYSVFIMGPTFDDFKESAWSALAGADTILVNGAVGAPGEDALALERRCKELNGKAKVIFASETGREEAYSIILSRIMGRLGGEYFMEEVDPKVAEELKKRSQEGRIPCAAALKLAEELGVSTLEVGKAANQLQIKIVNCSLGCF